MESDDLWHARELALFSIFDEPQRASRIWLLDATVRMSLGCLERSFVMPESWKIAGSYFETCNCDVACPCVFLSPPTNEDCTVLLAWHIDQGRFGQIDLDGLNAVLAVHSPGHMQEVKWEVALYVDERANQSQQDALTQIFSGQAGGHLALGAPLIGKVLGVKAAPIEYRSEGKTRSLRLGDVATAEIEGLPGQDGNDVTVANAPFAPVPGVPLVVAKSKEMRFSDYGLKCEVSNKNGFFSSFAYQSG
jgi:hypothetical protein